MTEAGKKGGFTLPGEAGYENLTLKLAEKWGADVIRDSDGTELSPEIIDAGYGIYSTICIIRGHNTWAKKNLDKLQQTFLITEPAVAVTDILEIDLLMNFYKEQFKINDSDEAIGYWQVYDRTTGEIVEIKNWNYNEQNGSVVITNCKHWHKYTVSFLAYRIWEEISMYNHVTNNWEKEHLMPVDPVYPEAQFYLLNWMKQWCEEHPAMTVVRFTSMFYNFVWIWGSDVRRRNLFTDWGSYDFTVSPLALHNFEKKYGYALTAEDFVNQGKYQVTHMPPTREKLDWMEFINDFVISFGKKLVETVHGYGKKAYVFYDDSWVGLEPYNDRFPEFGFDGIIKCVFSGYEARLCAGVNIGTHELRLHPYLFPVGLGGAPTFADGGNPTRDAMQYWRNVRRALLREPIQRIGLGGYLHLTENYPDFCDYIEKIANEFRLLESFHEKGKPWTLKTKVAVLHGWGKLRSWTLSGHFHETYMHDLIHVNEALSGLPVDVDFIDFNTVKEQDLSKYKVIINAGKAGDVWSGGDNWQDERIIEKLTGWVYEGGCLIGIGEPSAVEGYDTFFRMASVLGVDKDMGARVCHGKWEYKVKRADITGLEMMKWPVKEGIYLTDKNSEVLAEAADRCPGLVKHHFGKGLGIYMTGFVFSAASTRMLLELIMAAGGEAKGECIPDNMYVECAYYPEARKLVIINNSGEVQKAKVSCKGKLLNVQLGAYETMVENV